MDKTCINTQAFSVAAAALNSATDFLVFWWPVSALWRIQLPRRQRLGLVFVFAIGSMYGKHIPLSHNEFRLINIPTQGLRSWRRSDVLYRPAVQGLRVLL